MRLGPCKSISLGAGCNTQVCLGVVRCQHELPSPMPCYYLSLLCGLCPVREQKIDFFSRYFIEKSIFGQHRKEICNENSTIKKIAKKSGK